jgi:hypothetical protein
MFPGLDFNTLLQASQGGDLSSIPNADRFASIGKMFGIDPSKFGVGGNANTSRTGAIDNSRAAALQYLTSRGLDPSMFTDDIDAIIQESLAGLPSGTPIGSALTGLGERAFSREQDAARFKAGRDLDALFAPDFEYDRVGSTLDDPFIADILGQQRGEADAYINNLLKRGVINQTGATAALGNLGQQEGRVRTQLGDIGSGLIESGRQSQRDIANRARSRAATLPVGTQFNAAQYGTESQQSIDDFINSLGDQFKSRLPTGNLFDTSGLAAIAGGAQGAQNFRFDPRALSGANVDEDEEQPYGTTPGNKNQFNRFVF